VRFKMLALVIALSACASKEKETTAERKEPEPAAVAQQFSAPGVIVKKHDDTEIAWTIDEAGKVKAAVRKGGEAITGALDGELTWRDADGKEQRAPLELDSKTGLVQTKAPLSNASDVSYTLNVKGTPLRGTLAVPGASPPVAEPDPVPTASASPTPPVRTTPTSTPTPTPSQRKESSGRFPPKTR
jgi:hypothetical protein